MCESDACSHNIFSHQFHIHKIEYAGYLFSLRVFQPDIHRKVHVRLLLSKCSFYMWLPSPVKLLFGCYLDVRCQISYTQFEKMVSKHDFYKL